MGPKTFKLKTSLALLLLLHKNFWSERIFVPHIMTLSTSRHPLYTQQASIRNILDTLKTSSRYPPGNLYTNKTATKFQLPSFHRSEGIYDNGGWSGGQVGGQVSGCGPHVLFIATLWSNLILDDFKLTKSGNSGPNITIKDQIDKCKQT